MAFSSIATYPRCVRGLRARRAVAILTGVVAIVGCAAASAAAVPAARQQASGPLLLDEDFTGASAIPEFTGYGTACLTGAPVAGAPPAGEHSLSGCPAQGAPPSGFESLFPVSPPLGAAPNGFLRLTDALSDQSGAVLFDTPIQATDGVEITFEQWQYGGYSTIPEFAGQTADGISFFLVDAAASLDAPGAFGGSLGYAKKLPDDNPANAIVPGVAGGYLGFGFDVLRNFYGDWEQRGRGCPPDQLSPAGDGFQVPAPGENMVTVRGPVGADQTLGYCFLTATATGPGASTLPGSLHGSTTGPLPSDPAGTVAALEPSRRTVTMLLEPEPVHTITVSIDFHDGAGSQQVLSMVAPDPVPAAVKFGFAASTGAFTDVHLIRTLRMQAIDPEPALSLAKSVAPVVTGDLSVGAQLRYSFTVANVGGGAIDDIIVDDPRVPGVTCPATTLAEGTSMICTALYTITEADVAAGQVTNVAIATGTGRGGPVPPQTATAEISLAVLAFGGLDAAVLLSLGVAGIVLAATGGWIVRAGILRRRRT
jgi:hypothetical protein